MADNTTLNAGSGGDTYRSLEDGSSVKWAAAVVSYATTVGTPDVLQIVTPSAGLPVAQQGTWTVAGSGTFTVSGAVTQSGTWDVGTVASITNVVHVDDNSGSLTVDNGGTFAVQAAQSGTWTVTANIGTSGSLALDATLTGGTQKTKLVDTAGTNVATVSAAGALKVDGSAVTQPVSGTVTANAGTGTFTVSGAVTQSGTWNIATVTTVTTVSAVTGITNALPAGTNLLGKVSASNETDAIYSGSTALTPKFAAISASSSGDNSVVSAVTGKKIRVLRWSVSGSGTVNAKWRKGTTDVTGLYYLVANAIVGGGFCPVGHFETGTNEALQINLSGATAVGGVLTYVEV